MRRPLALPESKPTSAATRPAPARSSHASSTTSSPERAGGIVQPGHDQNLGRTVGDQFQRAGQPASRLTITITDDLDHLDTGNRGPTGTPRDGSLAVRRRIEDRGAFHPTSIRKSFAYGGCSCSARAGLCDRHRHGYAVARDPAEASETGPSSTQLARRSTPRTTRSRSLALQWVAATVRGARGTTSVRAATPWSVECCWRPGSKRDRSACAVGRQSGVSRRRRAGRWSELEGEPDGLG